MKTFNTDLGTIKYNERENSNEFLGLRYGKAERFKYVTPIDSYEGEYDATYNKDCCTQKRCFYEHLEIPERAFYHKEFREGVDFTYSEDCFFLNIWTPKKEGKYPVMIFIHGGGFDSGSIPETAFDGDSLAKRGIVVCLIQYRVGPFGYVTNETLEKENGRDGNFGLDDQFESIKWVKRHISSFYGDENNITLVGQSAGAMSIQYLCLYQDSAGLFNRAIMMSGAGLWPAFTLPRPCESTRGYWNEVMEIAGCNDISEFRKLDAKRIFDALEIIKTKRKDYTFHNMPVIDHYYLTDSVIKLIKKPLNIDYMVGVTNNDMFTVILASMAKKYRRQVNGYLYFFDCDAKGDNNLAFHSADLRYLFGTLNKSWRPYNEDDYKLSEIMMDYFTEFIKKGDPNKEGLPLWEKRNKALRLSDKKKIKMVNFNMIRLLKNTFKGDPK